LKQLRRSIFGLGVRTTILVVFKLKRGRAVLPCQAPWRSKVVLPHLPLWYGSLRIRFEICTLLHIFGFLDQEILLL
jgi:hypothetical protein